MTSEMTWDDFLSNGFGDLRRPEEDLAFGLDITEDVKALYDEHSRLADYWRGQAWSAETRVSELAYDGAGVDDLDAEADSASEFHETADLHEHTASILGIILGIGNEEDA